MGRHNDQSPIAKERRRELSQAHREYRVKRYRSLLMHWMGRWLRRPKRAHVTPLPSVVPGQVGISFSGHATVLLRYASRNIVCDPMLGKWVKGVKRAVMPGLTPADLHDVDIILISHGHQDHLHRPTLAAMPKSATVILPPRTAQLVSDLGFARVVELSPDQSIQDHGVDISTAQVRHGGDASMTMSYVIRGDGPSVYFCGDSGYFSGFADIGAKYAPDIALLPIGGYAPLSFRDRHMSPLDALYALEDLGSRIMIPIHHGAFSLSYERLDEPIRWLAQLVEERDLQDFVVPLEPGESRIFVPPSEQRVRDPLSSSESQLLGSGPSFDARQAARVEADDAIQASAESGSGLVQPLPATRAAARASADMPVEFHVEVNTESPVESPVGAWSSAAEPAWVRTKGRRLPQFSDAPQARPAFDLALEQAGEADRTSAEPDVISAVASVGVPADIEGATTDPMAFPASFPTLESGAESLPDCPLEEVPEELVIEQVAAVHSAPIELVEKSAPEPFSAPFSESSPVRSPEPFTDEAFDELEALVAARFTDESAAPASLLLSDDEDSDPLMDFDLQAALSDHFQRFPNSRLRTRMAMHAAERSQDQISTPVSEQISDQRSDRISRPHRLEPIPAFG